MTEEEVGNHWHLRREITVGTLVALVVYLITLIVIFTKLDSRVENLEKSSATITDARVAVVEARIASTREEIMRLEQRTVSSLTEINNSLRRIEDRLAGSRDAPPR